MTQQGLTASGRALSSNGYLLRWVEKMAELTQPSSIHWVDGSQEEYDELCQRLVDAGTFIRLNPDLWPGCFYARSDPKDVARVEDRTFICSLSKDAAGPTNHWEDPFVMGPVFASASQNQSRGSRFFSGSAALVYSLEPVLPTWRCGWS